MNDYKEYKKALNRFIGHINQVSMFPKVDEWNEKLFKEDLKTLHNLVDKQKPMKVFETDHSYICRNCSNIFTMKYDGVCVPCLAKIKYCPSCGQKQDWSDVCE